MGILDSMENWEKMTILRKGLLKVTRVTGKKDGFRAFATGAKNDSFVLAYILTLSKIE